MRRFVLELVASAVAVAVVVVAEAVAVLCKRLAAAAADGGRGWRPFEDELP